MMPFDFDLGEDFEAQQGGDLLSLALGREPGCSDLDEFVDFQIFYDGTPRAVSADETLQYLRARLCEAFELLLPDLERYLWHRDRFVLEPNIGEEDEEPHLTGHLRTGDGAEDEYFVCHLLRKLTAARADASCRLVDNDGELILIEAALQVPRWLNPSNAENRCWLRGGHVHILPRPRPPEPQRLPRREALARLRAAGAAFTAKERVQQAIEDRLEGYPRAAVDLSKHTVRAVLPAPIARLFAAFPQLVSVAVDHLPTPPAKELLRQRRALPAGESEVHLDCEGFPEEATVCVGIRFTRCQYARLQGLHMQLPQRFTQRHWKEPSKGLGPGGSKAMHLGATLCAGLEAAYLNGPQSATPVLLWPSLSLDAELLPTAVPWAQDKAFARHAAALKQPVDPTSRASRLAFHQQEGLEEDFRPNFLRWLRDERLRKAVNLEALWKDRDDPEEWLQVSAEELDSEMQARQAEFDAYDRRRAASSQQREAPTGAGAEGLRSELAAMGSEISRLLQSASSLDGVETAQNSRASPSAPSQPSAAQGDEPDSESDSEDLDVLGMEEPGAEADDGEEEEEEGALEADMDDYLAELDEQLETVLDGSLPAGANPALSGKNSLPLESRHIKVHSAEPLELDLHAMEHVLASFCSENHLEPGPASLLLSELGLGTAGGAGRGFVPSAPPVVATGFLHSLD